MEAERGGNVCVHLHVVHKVTTPVGGLQLRMHKHAVLEQSRLLLLEERSYDWCKDNDESIQDLLKEAVDILEAFISVNTRL